MLREDDTIPDRKTLKTLWPALEDIIDATNDVEIMAGDFQGYVFLLEEAEKRRQRENILQQMKKCLDINYTDGLLFNAEKLLEGDKRNNDLMVKPCQFEELLDIDRILTPEPKISTGIPSLNQHLGGEPNDTDFEELGGLALGEVTLVAGFTGHGKSTLSETILWNVLNNSTQGPNYKSVFFSYEVRKGLFLKQMFAHVTGVFPSPQYADKLFYKNAEEEYIRFMHDRKSNFLYYKENVPITVRGLEAEINKKAQQGYSLFIVDTINSLDNLDNAERKHTMEQAILMLERVAGKHNIAILATAQNKQALQFEEDKWPGIEWVGQSAYIQQKVGAGMGIYRNDIYSAGGIPYTSIALIKLRDRKPYPYEAVKVSFDKRRRLYVPYEDDSTAIDTSSSRIKTKQVFSALTGTYASDFIEPTSRDGIPF